jgi:ribosomal-protein-alanine N-acetyltransferase
MAGRAADIAPAGTADAGTLASLHAGSLAEPWSEPEMRRWLAMPAVSALLARRLGHAVGFVLAQRAADEAEILSFAVVPASRRQGVGGALLDRLEAALAAGGTASVHLEVAADNAAARALYAGRGYVETARRRAYYVSPGRSPVDAVTMMKRLAGPDRD